MGFSTCSTMEILTCRKGIQMIAKSHFQKPSTRTRTPEAETPSYKALAEVSQADASTKKKKNQKLNS